jgi:hypothetical protein
VVNVEVSIAVLVLPFRVSRIWLWRPSSTWYIPYNLFHLSVAQPGLPLSTILVGVVPVAAVVEEERAAPLPFPVA